MTRILEILVTEDNPKHLKDALELSKKYRNTHFYFASTLDEAKTLLGQRRYDAVVTDVFFPAKKGDKPSSNSGLGLAKKVHSLKIPYVFNTSGNHHGKEYSSFGGAAMGIIRADVTMDNGLYTGKVIEAYPEDSEGEKDTKQWWAAINYSILLARASELEEGTREGVGSLLSFAPYGDYGELTGYMQKVLNLSNTEKDLCRCERGEVPYRWSRDAMDLGRQKGKISWEKKSWNWDKTRDCFVSNEAQKESIESWFNATEAEFKKKYVAGMNAIREILYEYLPTTR